MTSHQVVPALIIPFIAWRVYRRARRNIGRQPLRRTRLKISIGLFTAIILLVGGFSLGHPANTGALAGGLALSVALAWWGLRLTQFESSAEGDFYTPNTALGIAITTLFVGRMAYRFLVLGGGLGSAAAVGAPDAFRSPLTLFLFGVTAGYFIAYQLGVLLHRRAAAT